MPISDAEDLLTTVPHEKYHHVCKQDPADSRNTADAFHETSVTHSIFKILAENSLVLARLNLNNGEYEILKRDYRLHGCGLEMEHDFESYNRRILNEKLIHPDDEEQYRARITLSSLHDFFFDGQKQLSYQFRRQLNNEYIHTVMEFFAGNRCDVQNPWIVVLIREIS